MTGGFRFEYTLAADEAVYGLGEALRGINKRGGLYESCNLDHSFHMEDVLSLFKNMDKGICWINVALNEVPMFVKKNHIVPLAGFAETVCSLNEEDLTTIGWITEPVSYTLYLDDGYTKDYEHPSHRRIIKKIPDYSSIQNC